jgi:hypothetical protein
VSVAFAFGLAVASAVSGYAGPLVLAGVVVTCQVLAVASWHRAIDAPGGAGGSVVALSTGVGAVALLLAREDARQIAPLTGLLGAATVAVLLHQLARRTRSHVAASMTATGALVVFTLSPALYIPATSMTDGPAVVAVVVLAAAAAHAVDVFGMPWGAATVVALATGAAIGMAGGAATGLSLAHGIGAGLAAAAVAFVVTRWLHTANHPPPWLSAALPICLAAPVAYVAARIGGG